MIEEICKPIIIEEFYKILPELIPIPIPDPHPEPDWKRIINLLPQNLRRNSRLTEELKLIAGTIPAYRPWAKKISRTITEILISGVPLRKSCRELIQTAIHASL